MQKNPFFDRKLDCMADYIISCESTADLSADKFAELGVEVIYFHFSLDGVEYMDDLGQSIPFPEFYQSMLDGKETKTAAVGTGDYEEFFRKFLEQGKDVLHVSLSSGISSTVDSARIAAQILQSEFPDRKIYIMDSLAASSGFGLLMQALSEKRDEGMGIDEARDWFEANKLRLHHWFFSTDLTWFVKGGRVKPAAGFVGNLLGICPLLNVDYQGHLIPREKIRTKKKVIKRIVEKMADNAVDGNDYTGKVYISNSACYEDAKAVADLIKKQFPNMDGEPLINWIGTTIGSHTGPGTVALFFWGGERID